MITLISGILAAAFILLALRALTKDYPESAIAIARHNLFQHRDALFDIAAEGDVAFSHPGYKAARDMINAFIRYAHDLSFTQLMLTRFLLFVRNAKLPSSDWEVAIESLPDSSKAKVKEVVNDATVAMFRLMVTRSLFLSATLAVIVAVRGISIAIDALAKKWRSRAPEQHKSASDEVYEEVLSHTPGARFSFAVKQEAKRYSFAPGAPLLQAA